MNMYIFILLISIAMLLLPDPKPAKSAATYFPTRVGDKWVYSIKSKSGKEKEIELIEEITAVSERGGVLTVTVSRAGEDGKMYKNREREISAEGILQVKNAIGERYDSPWIHLKLPHKAEQSWKVAQLGAVYIAYGPEKITVPAGTFAAIRVEQRNPVARDRVTQTEWFAVRYGIVKLETPDSIIVLKSFTPARD